jgi:hypothetical protein
MSSHLPFTTLYIALLLYSYLFCQTDARPIFFQFLFHSFC